MPATYYSPQCVKSMTGYTGAGSTEVGSVRKGQSSTIMLGNQSRDYGASSRSNWYGGFDWYEYAVLNGLTVPAGYQQNGPYCIYIANPSVFTPPVNPTPPDPDFYPAPDTPVAASPQFRFAVDDTAFIQIAAQFGAGAGVNTIPAAINHFQSLNNVAIANRDYEPIVTNGLRCLLDPGFIWSCPRSAVATQPWYDIAGFSTSYNLSAFSGTPQWKFSLDTISPAGTVPAQGCLQLNATSNQYASTAAQPAPITEFTVCAWVNSTVVTGTAAFVNATGAAGFTTNVTSGWGLGRLSGANLSFRYYQGTNSRSVALTSTMAANTWYYVAATWVQSTGVATVYAYNGSLSETNSNSFQAGGGTGIAGTSSVMQLGFGNIASTYHTGGIGVVKVYGRALTSTEIKQNHNAQCARYGVNPLP